MAYCEIDKDAQSVLRKHMAAGHLDTAPIIDDVKDLGRFMAHGPLLPDMLTAGFPCTGFSSCGHRQGLDDPRSAQILQVLRALRRSRIPLVLLENSPNVKNCTQLTDEFQKLGYRWAAVLPQAFMVGLPQSRTRWYALFVHSSKSSDLDHLYRTLKVKRPRVREPPRTTPARLPRANYCMRYSLLGRAIVPACAQLAIHILAQCLLDMKTGLQDPPKCTKPNLHLVLSHSTTVIHRQTWPTPISSNPRPCNKLNYRISQDLASAIKFEKSTIPGQLNLEWVEWLMGFPRGWTENSTGKSRR